MRYSVAPEIFAAFPGYIRGVVVARGCRNTLEDPSMVARLRAAEAAVRADPRWDAAAAVPRIAAWRAAFSRFGATPSKFPSSVEAILKRAHKGDTLPYINDLVALGTYLTLAHALPTGGHDLDRVDGDVTLCLARGDEPFLPIGATVMERPDPGEVIYRDGVKVLCRRWVWRQADQDKMTLETRNLEMNVDGLPPATVNEVAAAMSECSRLLRVVTGGETEEWVLTADNPVVDL